MYEMITAPSVESKGYPRPKRNPFVNFRPAEEEKKNTCPEEHSEIEVEETVLYKDCDPSERQALMMQSTGEKVYADRYREGENGFPIEVRDRDGKDVELHLEVPSGSFKRTAPSAPSPRSPRLETASTPAWHLAQQSGHAAGSTSHNNGGARTVPNITF